MPETNPNPNQPESAGTVPQPAESFRTVPNVSAKFGNVPHVAEPFRSVPNPAETFRNERKSSHTLTVREAARLFETAGVARTERSIVNWCQPNAHAVARLDAFFDVNDRRWFITPESVERAIAEEQAKAKPIHSDSISERLPKESASNQPHAQERAEPNPDRVKELEFQLRDLEITNRVKDRHIDELRQEREAMLNKLVDAARNNGILETKLRVLEAPRGQA